MSKSTPHTAVLAPARRGPRGALPAAIALVLFVLLATLIASRTEPTLRSVQDSPLSTHQLVFHDRSDGAVVVTFPGAQLERRIVLAPGTHNFIRGVMRGLARDRRARGVGAEAVFQLTQWRDGRLELADPATGRRIPLESFGPTNLAEFRALIHPSPDA